MYVFCILFLYIFYILFTVYRENLTQFHFRFNLSNIILLKSLILQQMQIYSITYDLNFYIHISPRIEIFLLYFLFDLISLSIQIIFYCETNYSYY